MTDKPMCVCGHDMYSHYMCGAANSMRCLTGCGCKQYDDVKCGPSSYKPHARRRDPE